MSPNEIDSITHHPGPVLVAEIEAASEYLEPTTDTGTIPLITEEIVSVPVSTRATTLKKRRSPPLPAREHVVLATEPRLLRSRWRTRLEVAGIVAALALAFGITGFTIGLFTGGVLENPEIWVGEETK